MSQGHADHKHDVLYPLRHYFAAVNTPVGVDRLAKAALVADAFAQDGVVIDQDGNHWTGRDGKKIVSFRSFVF
jgi:hypothetical protein